MNAFSFTQRVSARVFAAIALFSLIAGMIPTQAFAVVAAKTFTATASPSQMNVGATQTVVFTIKNTTATGEPNPNIKSGGITIPAGFTVTSASISKSGWAISPGSQYIEMSDQASPDPILPNETFTVTAVIQHTGNAPVNSLWDVCVYHNNSFNPGSGGDFVAGTGMTSGACGINVGVTVVQPVVDQCPNIPEVQATIPTGMVKDGSGNCVTPIVDVCSNIAEIQTEVPAGYYAEGGACYPNPVDMCPNIPEVQATIPSGLIVNDNGDCVEPPVDVCPNLENLQTEVPTGYHLADGQCVPDAVDMCPNISEVQATIPSGLIVNDNGDCVEPPVDVCPNLENLQTEVPTGYELVDGQCVIPVVDQCPNIPEVQATIPTGMVKDGSGNCVTPIVDVCSNIPEVQATIPDGYHLEGESTCVENGGGGPDPIYGCTDKEANNYDPEATSDDKSCTYGYLTQCIGGVEAQNLLVNGSFEDSVGLSSGNWGIFTLVNGWTHSLSSGLELWNNMFAGASHGVQNAELDGEDATKITQTVNGLIAGGTYELSFDFAARDTNAEDNHIEAMADGVSLVNQSTSNTEWLKYGATFTSDGSTDISFVDLGTPQEGIAGTGTLLDNAKLCLVRDPGDTDPELYKITGYVWHDDNRNGEWDGQDDEEQGNEEGVLEGRTIRITNGEDTFETTTDVNGYYEFNVPAGTWTITEQLPIRWFHTATESHTVTVPAVDETEETIVESIVSLIIPTAYAADVVDTYGDYNFGNDRRNGGGGGNNNDDDEDEPEGDVLGATDDAPEGEVLGEQVDAVPTGAPDAGAGGTSRSLEFFNVVPVALIRRK